MRTKLTFRSTCIKSGAVRCVIRIVAVVVLVFSLGLHWAVLQSVAWMGMMVSYSHNSSFTEAVTRTFDGEHPCKMCHAIKEARADEKQEEKQNVKPGSKSDWGLIWQAVWVDIQSQQQIILSACSKGPQRSYEPPKPRPRFPLADDRV